MFDLSAYLDRIHLPAGVPTNVEGLQLLQRAHRLAIPFENLDIPLGRAIAIDASSVFTKLVTGGRGGYCFEHNRLFGDALAVLGFEARPLLARVWLNAAAAPPLNHAVTLVTVGGEAWLADAGFGASYAPPMPLTDGAEAAAPDGARWRLAADAALGWMLSRDGPTAATDGRGGERQYSFALSPVTDTDLAQGNVWAQSSPDSRFTRLRVVSLPLSTGFASLTDRVCRGRTPTDDTAEKIPDAGAYRLRLRETFGIDLSADEVAALGLF